MKRVWKRISALLVVCAVLAALAPAALADGGADTYRIAVSAVPAVVTAGGSATVSATVYSRSETDGEWSEYLGGGAVITWQAYREGVAAFRGEDADKPVTTALNAGSSSSSLELLTKAGGVTGSAVQLPLSVSVTVGGKTQPASAAASAFPRLISARHFPVGASPAKRWTTCCFRCPARRLRRAAGATT